MSKKNKAKSLIDTMMKRDAAEQAASLSAEIAEAKAAEENKLEQENPIQEFKDNLPLNPNAADRQKLELYDKLVDESTAAIEEKDQMMDKVAAYLEEIDSLKSELSLVRSRNQMLEQENANLKKKHAEMADAPDQADIDALKAENDKYLLKISELSFQIAELKADNGNTCRCGHSHDDKLCVSASKLRPCVEASRSRMTALPHNVKYVRNSNGYDSWN